MGGLVALGAVGSVLAGALLWGGVSLLLAVVIAVPAVVTRDWTAIVPWPLSVLAAFAVLTGAIDLYPELAGYLLIAAAALIVVVELDVFTPVELGRRFAVAFGVLTTMATEAVWIVAQYYSDQWLGTDFLTTQTELQRDIVVVTVVGFTVGSLFYWYVTRFEPAEVVDRPTYRTRTR
ncbi:hypothetical protein [Halopiger thermotolerans]